MERRNKWRMEEYGKEDSTRVDNADALGDVNPSLDSELSSNNPDSFQVFVFPLPFEL